MFAASFFTMLFAMFYGGENPGFVAGGLTVQVKEGPPIISIFPVPISSVP
jgi:hypothetical protein